MSEKKKATGFWVRLLSGIALLVILITVIVLNGPVLEIFTLLISLCGFMELVRACGVRNQGEKAALPEIVGYVGILCYDGLLFLGSRDAFQQYGMLVLILTIMGMLLCYVLTFPRYDARQVMAATFAYFYAPVLLSYIYQTRNLPGGKYVVWLIFCASWACDTCAYAVGMLFGKHKMAPVLSPKKSVEGAIGGIVGAALVGFLYALALKLSGVLPPGGAKLYAFGLISAVGAVLSQAGDLAASGIKRNYGMKDYGRLIPGHGGIMDRFDSVIVTAPLIYYLAKLLLM